MSWVWYRGFGDECMIRNETAESGWSCSRTRYDLFVSTAFLKHMVKGDMIVRCMVDFRTIDAWGYFERHRIVSAKT